MTCSVMISVEPYGDSRRAVRVCTPTYAMIFGESFVQNPKDGTGPERCKLRTCEFLGRGDRI